MTQKQFIKFLKKHNINFKAYENYISFNTTQRYCLDFEECSIVRYFNEDDEEADYFESLEDIKCNNNSIVISCDYDGNLEEVIINIK